MNQNEYEAKKEQLWRDFNFRVNALNERIRKHIENLCEVYHAPIRTPADSLLDALWPICAMGHRMKWCDFGTYDTLTSFVTEVIETRFEEYDNALKMLAAQK